MIQLPNDSDLPDPPASSALNRRSFLKLGAAGVGAMLLHSPAMPAQAHKVKTTARIVIAGAGAAGLTAASQLANRLDGARITIIDARQAHLYQPGFTLIAAGVRRVGRTGRRRLVAGADGQGLVVRIYRCGRSCRLVPDRAGVRRRAGRHHHPGLRTGRGGCAAVEPTESVKCAARFQRIRNVFQDEFPGAASNIRQCERPEAYGKRCGVSGLLPVTTPAEIAEFIRVCRASTLTERSAVPRVISKPATSWATVRYDLDVKVPLYANSGIPEVWLLDLQNQQLEVYRDPVNGRYQQKTGLRTGKIAPVLCPDAVIDLAEVFP